MVIGPKISEEFVNSLEQFFYNVVDDVLASYETDYFHDEAESEISATLKAHQETVNSVSKENWEKRPSVKEWNNYYGNVLFNATIVVWVCEIRRTLTNCPISSDGYAMACERKVFVYDLVRDRL